MNEKRRDSRASRFGYLRLPQRRLYAPLIILITLLWFIRGSVYKAHVWSNVSLFLLNHEIVVQLTGSSSKKSIQAETALKQAVTYTEENSSVWRGLGLILAMQGQGDKASVLWNNTSEISQVLVQHGVQAHSLGRYEMALASYEHAMKIRPEWEEPWYRIGQVYSSQRKWDEAIRAFQQATQLAPTNRNVWYELGEAYLSNELWDSAMRAFKLSLGADDGTVGLSNVYFHIGRLYQSPRYLGDLDSAWKAYDQALALDDYTPAPGLKVETYYQRGNILASQNYWEEAIEEYQQVLEINAEHYWTYLSLASALWQLDKHREAKEMAQYAIHLNPGRTNAYRLLGDFYKSEGNLIEAQAMYNVILTLVPLDE